MASYLTYSPFSILYRIDLTEAAFREGLIDEAEFPFSILYRIDLTEAPPSSQPSPDTSTTFSILYRIDLTEAWGVGEGG